MMTGATPTVERPAPRARRLTPTAFALLGFAVVAVISLSFAWDRTPATYIPGYYVSGYTTYDPYDGSLDFTPGFVGVGLYGPGASTVGYDEPAGAMLLAAVPLIAVGVARRVSKLSAAGVGIGAVAAFTHSLPANQLDQQGRQMFLIALIGAALVLYRYHHRTQRQESPVSRS